MKFAAPILSILVALVTMATTVSVSLKGTNDNNSDDMKPRRLGSKKGPKKPKFKFVDKPFGLRFGGSIASLGAPIVGMGRLILQESPMCSFNGFGNLNSTFIAVSSAAATGGNCSYSFDPSLGQGTFSLFLPSLGPLAASSYKLIMVEGGKTIFFVNDADGVFVMVAEQQ
jgi:hypothetical protein